MDLFWALAIVTLIAICMIGLGRQLWRLSCSEGLTAHDLAQVEEFSAQRYRPIQRLLSTKDIIFLRSAAPSRQLVRRHKAARRRLLRLYVTALICDYRRLQALAALQIATSPHEEGLSQFLLQQQLLFYAGLLLVGCRITLQTTRLGWALEKLGAAGDIRLLINSADALAHRANVLPPFPVDRAPAH